MDGCACNVGVIDKRGEIGAGGAMHDMDDETTGDWMNDRRERMND